MARRSRRNHEEKENTDRWLLTYSDLITLLMIFFVIMYAMSKVDQVKFYQLEQSLSQAMHQSKDVMQGVGAHSLLMAANPTDNGEKLQTSSTTASSQTQQQDNQAFDNLYQEINQYIQQHHLQANVTIANQVRGIQVTFRDVVLFGTGQATLKPQAKQILNGLVPFIQKVNNPVVVEGYTDNQPIHTAQYPSNWELSASRAINVVEYLSSQHVSPARLSGVGYGQYHPIVPNNSPANRQKNRRVNIVIMRDNGTQTEPVNATTP